MLRTTLLVFMLCSPALFGQVFYRYEPYDYKLEVPPEVALPHKRVAIYPKGEYGAEELGTALRNLLLDEHEILAREDLDSILAENNLSLDGVISKNKAMGIGKYLGPTALIIIDLQRLRVADQMVSTGAKRSITLKADVRVVDVKSGRIVFAKAVSEQKEEVGQLDYPDEELLRERVFSEVENRFSQWFAPKVEKVRLEFHTPKRRPSFKESYAYFAGGDPEKALEVMETNINALKTEITGLEEKQAGLSGKALKKNQKAVKRARQDLGRGWQNLALIHVILSNFNDARRANGQAKALSDMSQIYQFPAFIDKCEKVANQNKDYERILKKRS